MGRKKKNKWEYYVVNISCRSCCTTQELSRDDEQYPPMEEALNKARDMGWTYEGELHECPECSNKPYRSEGI